MTPPAAFITERHAPEFTGTTNSDLLHYSIELLEIIDKHNQDKQMIRVWEAEIQ